jgi:hypothetical protein
MVFTSGDGIVMEARWALRHHPSVAAIPGEGVHGRGEVSENAGFRKFVSS